MVFNKLGRIFNLRIPFKGKVIEPCSRYDYLGTTFTPGSFSLGRKLSIKQRQVELCLGLCFRFSVKLT